MDRERENDHKNQIMERQKIETKKREKSREKFDEQQMREEETVGARSG